VVSHKYFFNLSLELPGEETYDTHLFWELAARCNAFRERWRLPNRKSVHINVAELEAFVREEAKIGLKHQSVRCGFALDSQVALGALVKGRSSSKSLNNLLRRSLAVHLGSDLYSNFGYFPSPINPADGPTRGKPPRDPDLPKPSWWSAVADGRAGNDPIC